MFWTNCQCPVLLYFHIPNSIWLKMPSLKSSGSIWFAVSDSILLRALFPFCYRALFSIVWEVFTLFEKCFRLFEKCFTLFEKCFTLFEKCFLLFVKCLHCLRNDYFVREVFCIGVSQCSCFILYQWYWMWSKVIKLIILSTPALVRIITF